MDDAELSVSNSNRNEVLSQSYSQGLERISCKNATTDYQLPAGLIRMREDQWEEFFKRYDKELGEDLEIDLHTDYDEEEENKNAEENSAEESDFNLRQLDSDVEESEDSDDDDDDEEEEEEEDEEQYFEKNRAPLRKTPNLIQYWIDTGRPPILMTEEPEEFRELVGEDNPEPAVGKIKTVNSTEAEAKRPSNSVFSSVDTAAYILSNTNVTAKAETIAIVEGAKSLDLNDINVNSEVPDLVNGIACDKNSSPLKNSPLKKHHSPNKNIKALRINKPSPVKEIEALIEAPKNLDVNNINNQNSNTIFKEKDTNNLKPRLNNNPIAQCSPKIADVLPTHEDPTKAKVIESSNISKEYDNENSLKSLKINWNNNNNTKIDFTVNNGRKTLRKKLYTQRNSPVTIVSTTPISVHSNFNDSDYFESRNKINYETESNKMLGKLHPVFATPFNKKSKVKKIKRASWARRMSRYSKVNKSSEAEETIATPGPDNSVENNSQDDKLNSGKKEEEDKSAKKKKKLIKAKKIRQSIRPKELINYGEFFSEEEKLDKSKENNLEGTEGTEKEAKEALEEVKSKELDKKNNEACDLLKVCKKLTINLEPLPDNYLKNRSKNVENQIQNLEDSLESDGSTILMYECALNGKDVNTDTETGTEVSRHESEDDKSQKSGIESVKKSKKFVQRCLGSLSDKNLTEIGAGNSISARINDTDDEDDDLELGKVSSVTIQSSDVKATNKNLKERLISFSSDEEDDFLKILSKNKSQARMSVSKLDGLKNYDSLVSDLAGESRVRLSSLVTTPMAVLKIVSDSEDEQLISQDDLNVKKRLSGVKKEKSPKVRSKRLEMLEKRKGRFSFAEDKIEESGGSLKKIEKFNGLADNHLSLEADKAKFKGKILNGGGEEKDLKKTRKKNKFGKSLVQTFGKKRLSKIAEFDSSDEPLVSPPKKIKIIEGKLEASGDGNSELESIKLGCKNSKIKDKGLDSLKGKKLEEINCKLKLKEVQSPGTDLQSNFKTPVNKIIKSNVYSNSNKKRVSFSATKLEKILVYDSDSSDDSFFISNKSPNGNFKKIENNNHNNSSNENGKISSNKRITFSSSGCSLANIKVFSSRFVSDSDDSND